MSVSNQPYHHGNLRQALLETALGHLKQVGADQISLRALARDVGVSQTAPYRHFADKTALLAALAAAGFDRLREVTQTAGEEQKDAAEALIASGLAYIHFARDNPELYKLMFGPVLGSPGQFEELTMAGNRAFNVIIELVERGIRENLFKQEHTLLMANTAWATVHGIASLLIDGLYQCVGIDNPDAQLEKSLRISMAGFGRS